MNDEVTKKEKRPESEAVAKRPYQAAAIVEEVEFSTYSLKCRAAFPPGSCSNPTGGERSA